MNKTHKYQAIGAILAASGTLTLTIQTFLHDDKQQVSSETLRKNEPCYLSESEKERLTEYCEQLINEKIPYECCRYYKQTETEIVLLEEYPFLYTVKNGETIERILNTFFVIDTKEKYKNLKLQFLEYNHLPPDDTYTLSKGEMIYIPLRKTYSINKEDAYTIMPGDTIYSISRKFNVNQDLLETINGIDKDTHLIYAGNYMVIPSTNKEFRLNYKIKQK